MKAKPDVLYTLIFLLLL